MLIHSHHALCIRRSACLNPISDSLTEEPKFKTNFDFLCTQHFLKGQTESQRAFVVQSSAGRTRTHKLSLKNSQAAAGPQ